MAFAERVAHLAPEGAYHMLARAQALEAQGRRIIHLEIGQPDGPTFDNIVEAGVHRAAPGPDALHARRGHPAAAAGVGRAGQPASGASRSRPPRW